MSDVCVKCGSNMTNSTNSVELVGRKLKEMKYDLLAAGVLNGTAEYLYSVCLNCNSRGLVIIPLQQKDKRTLSAAKLITPSMLKCGLKAE